MVTTGYDKACKGKNGSGRTAGKFSVNKKGSDPLWIRSLLLPERS